MLRFDVQLKPRQYKESICRVCRPQKCLKVDRKSCSDAPYTIFDVQLKPRQDQESICRVCRPQKCLKVDRKSCSDAPYTIFDATSWKICGRKFFYKLYQVRRHKIVDICLGFFEGDTPYD